MPDSRNRVSDHAKALLSKGFASRLFSGFVIVAVLNLGAKAISFGKDATVARWFGTSDEMDAFVLAFGLLSFLATVLGGGLPEAFLPNYAQVKHEKSWRRAQRLAVQSALTHGLSLILLAALLWWAAPGIISFTARGFSAEKQALSIDLMRRLLPFMVCLGMSFQLAIWLRADKRFAISTGAPAIVPITIIVFLVWDDASIDKLVEGTLWGSLLHVLVLLVALIRHLPSSRSWRRMLLRRRENHYGDVLRGAAPFLLASLVYGSATVIDQAMAAALLEDGAVSVLSYSEKLVGILLALTAIPAGEVLFPYFADAVAARDWKGLRTQLKRASLWVGGVAVPASVALFALAPWVVSLLFERGEFTAEDTERVAAVLRIAVFQVPFYIVGMLCSRVVVALQATRFIVLLSVLTMVVNAGLNWPLMLRMGAPGVALSTVIVAMLSCAVVTMYTLRVIRQREQAG